MITDSRLRELHRLYIFDQGPSAKFRKCGHLECPTPGRDIRVGEEILRLVTGRQGGDPESTAWHTGCAEALGYFRDCGYEPPLSSRWR